MNCIITEFKHIVRKTDTYAKQELKVNNIPILSQHIIIFHMIGDQNIKFKELQSKLGFSKSTLSDAIKRYEDIGLIAKFECALDKRDIYLKLTNDGKQIFDKLEEIDSKIKERIYQNISCEEAENLEEIIHKVFEGLK